MPLNPKPTPPAGARLLPVSGQEPNFILWNFLVKRPLDDGWHNYGDFSKVQSTGQIVAGTDGKKWLKADGYNGETIAFTGYVYLEDRDVNWYDVPTELIPVPDTPTNLSVTAGSSTELNLMWTNPGGSSIEVERGLSGAGPFAKINSTTNNIVGYTDRNRTPNTTYFYRIRAVNASGASPYSEVIEMKTPETPPPAPAPTPAAEPAPPPVTPAIPPASLMALEILANLPKPMVAATPAKKSWLETNLTLVLAGVGVLVLVVLVVIAKRN